MVLEALELALRTNLTEDVSLPKSLTIEHLMPQNWQQHWPLPEATSEATLIRNRLLHTVGNLTLVTASLNSLASNAAWSDKRKALCGFSVLNLKQSFEDVATWDETAIVKRSELLFAVAQKLWPRPN
jgi:hypothetical protein